MTCGCQNSTGEFEVKMMKEAVKLSRDKMMDGAGGPFGALVVKEGEILSKGFNQVTSVNDPTAHAEIDAIRKACHRLGTYDLSGCDIYTSCEPCPMCLGAIYWAHLDKIYYASSRDEAVVAGFQDAFIEDELVKPVAQRKIPMIRVPVEGAMLPFELWLEKADKKLY